MVLNTKIAIMIVSWPSKFLPKPGSKIIANMLHQITMLHQQILLGGFK